MYKNAIFTHSLSFFWFYRCLLVITLVCSAFTVIAHADINPHLTPVRFMPLWTPQAQFAGYYMAHEKGIYAKHGIHVKILESGPGFSPSQALKNGKADFAALWLSTAVGERAQGTDLVNLAQLIQKSSLMLITKKSSGIDTLEAMQGKKISLWGGDLSIPIMAVLNKKNIPIREIRQSQTINLFLRGGIDATSAMWYNEYHTILSSGVNPEELNVFFMSEYNMNFPEDGIYALRNTVQKDPKLAHAFVNATLEGWRYAFEHPEEAVEVTLKYMRQAGLPANSAHQTWMLNRMRDLLQPLQAGQFGELNPQSYHFVVNRMQQDKLIVNHADYNEFKWKFNAKKN
jgi:NitT/TauT family transport system substrate-binding protein